MHAEACGHCHMDEVHRQAVVNRLLSVPIREDDKKWWLRYRNRKNPYKLTSSIKADLSGITTEEFNFVMREIFEHISHPDAEQGVRPSAISAHVPAAYPVDSATLTDEVIWIFIIVTMLC